MNRSFSSAAPAAGDSIRTARLPSARCVTFARAGASPASNTIVRTPSRRNRVASLFIRAERASEYGGLGTIVGSRATRLETTAARRRPPLGAPAEVRDDDRDLRMIATPTLFHTPRRFARWPGLSIHQLTTWAGVASGAAQARFSPAVQAT